MERYIGLDAHAASCSLAVVDARGKKVSSTVVETDRRALIETIRAIPGRKYLCLEEGTCSSWLFEILEPHVDELVVTSEGKRPGHKSDARDALYLANALRTNSIERRVFKAPRQFAKLRSLTRLHMMVGRDLSRTKIRLRTVFRSRGISTTELVYRESGREEWLRQLPSHDRIFAAKLYEQLDFHSELKDEAEKNVLVELKKHKIASVLQTCPGLGPIRVARLMTIVVAPHRFRTKRQFWSYCGLGIVMRSSADWKMVQGRWQPVTQMQTRGLNRQHNHTLKDVFKGAALTAAATENPLRPIYDRLLEAGTKPPLARLNLARKIAAISLKMWKNEEVFRLPTTSSDKT